MFNLQPSKTKLALRWEKLTAFSVSVTCCKFPSTLICCWWNETCCLTLFHGLICQETVTWTSNRFSFWQLHDNSFANDWSRDGYGGITGSSGYNIGGSCGVDCGLIDIENGHECRGVCLTVATLNLVTVTTTRYLTISRTFREFTPCSPVSW